MKAQLVEELNVLQQVVVACTRVAVIVVVPGDGDANQTELPSRKWLTTYL